MDNPFQSNVEVVVFSLDILGGASKKISTEEIAIKAYEIAPDRFSWINRKFSHFPDKLVAKTALEDAAKKKTGRFVVGSYARDESRDGWTLTPEGIKWLNSNRERINLTLTEPEERPSMRPLDMKRFLSRIKDSAAYKEFSKQGTLEEVTEYLFADLLQASPDAPRQIFHAKINRLLKVGELSKDEDIQKFLIACENKFFDEIGSSTEELYEQSKN